jgi:hypothetical protein
VGSWIFRRPWTDYYRPRRVTPATLPSTALPPATPDTVSAAWAVAVVTVSNEIVVGSGSASWSVSAVAPGLTLSAPSTSGSWATSAVSLTLATTPASVTAAWAAEAAALTLALSAETPNATWAAYDASGGLGYSVDTVTAAWAVSGATLTLAVTPVTVGASWATSAAANTLTVTAPSVSAAWSSFAAAVAVVLTAESNTAAWAAAATSLSLTVSSDSVSGTWAASDAAAGSDFTVTADTVTASWATHQASLTLAVDTSSVTADWSANAATTGTAAEADSVTAAWAASASSLSIVVTAGTVTASWAAYDAGGSSLFTVSPDTVTASWAASAASLSLAAFPTTATGNWLVSSPALTSTATASTVTANWTTSELAYAGEVATALSATANWATHAVDVVLTDTAAIPTDWYEPITVNQPVFSGSDYPFVKPSDDIRFLLGDFYLAYDNADCAYVLPLKVAWLSGFGEVAADLPEGMPTPVHAQDILVTDANGIIVFDSTTAVDFVQVAWGDNKQVVEWKTVTGVARLVRYLGSVSVFPQHIVPESGELDGRTYRAMSKRITSVRVGLQTLAAGNLDWLNGYNIRMTPQALPRIDGGRLATSLEVRARPGDGLGRLPGCEDAAAILRKINQIGPDAAGNFTLDGEGCFRVQRPTALVSADPRQVDIAYPGLTAAEALASLQYTNDCGPCCECNDFVRVYEGLRNVNNRYMTMGDRAEAVRDMLADNIERWEGQMACRTAKPMRLTLNQEYECKVAVGGLFCNMSGCCITGLTLRMTLQVFKDGEIDPTVLATEFLCNETKRAGTDTDYTEEPYTMDGAYPVFDTKFEVTDPQTNSRMRTRIRFPGCSNGQTLKVTFSAHAETPIDDDGNSCPLPSASVPSDILELWTAAGVSTGTVSLMQKSIPLIPDSACR